MILMGVGMVSVVAVGVCVIKGSVLILLSDSQILTLLCNKGTY